MRTTWLAGIADVLDGQKSVGLCEIDDQPVLRATGGSEYRMVVDFAEPDRFLAVQNVGNSGQPGSPHYADQFPAWLAGEYHTVALNRVDVERDLEGTTILLQAESPPG